MDILPEVMKWLPQGGAAGAVITVVWLFLKQQDRMADLMVSVTGQFKTTLEAFQAKNDEKHEALARRHEEQTARLQEQFTTLVRDQIEVNTKMTVAIEGLQSAVVELQDRRHRHEHGAPPPTPEG